MNETRASVIKGLFADHQDQLAELGVTGYSHYLVDPVVWVWPNRQDSSPAVGETCVGITHFYQTEGEPVEVQLIGTVAGGAVALLESMNRIYSTGHTPPAGQIDAANLAKILQLPEFLFGNIPLAHSQLGIYRHLGPYRELSPKTGAPKEKVLASGIVPLEDGTVLDVTLSVNY